MAERRRMRRRRRGQNHRGAKHAGEALCWATVPLRETTVEKLEMRKKGGGKRRGEGGRWGGGQKARCKEHQVSAAVLFAGGVAPTLRESVKKGNCRCSEMMSGSGCGTDLLYALRSSSSSCPSACSGEKHKVQRDASDFSLTGKPADDVAFSRS